MICLAHCVLVSLKRRSKKVMERGQVFAQEENTYFSFFSMAFFLQHYPDNVDPLKSSAVSICFELSGRNFSVSLGLPKKGCDHGRYVFVAIEVV